MRRAGGWRASMVVLFATALLVTAPTAAVAAPPPGTVRPTQCLEEFTANDGYVGDGWPQARVLTVRDVRLGRDVSLFCGDELSGVVHIAHPESTGTVHPVTAADEDAMLACLAAVIAQGNSEPDEASGGRIKYQYQYRDLELGSFIPPAFATAYVDDARGFVYTLFTGRDGNNWAECARGARRFDA